MLCAVGSAETQVNVNYKTKCYGKQDLVQNHGLKESFRGETTMTLGHKSIYIIITIPNKENPVSPYKIKVQANKNLGICDIEPRIGETLTDFQGRQINNADVIYHLQNVLTEKLNSHE